MRFINCCCKKSITVLLTLTVFVSMTGCNLPEEQIIASDKVEQQKETLYQSEQVENSYFENEMNQDNDAESFKYLVLPEDLAKFQNNGGAVVRYGEWTYYWVYHQDSVESAALWSNYDWNAAAENTLVRENIAGVKQELYTGPGFGNIFIVKDRLFLMGKTNDAHADSYIYSLTLTGQNYVDCGLGIVCAADSDAGMIVILDEALDLYLLDVVSGKRTLAAKQAAFLGWEDGSLYYQPHPDVKSESLISMWKLDIESGICSELLSFEDPWRLVHNGISAGETAIRTIQITAEDIFFSCGFYAGSGNVFQGGSVFRYHKGTAKTEAVVTLSFGHIFYYFENAGKNYLLYEGDDFQNMIYSFDESASTETTMQAGTLQEPFSDMMGDYWVYNDMTGKAVLLASRDANQSTTTSVVPNHIACVGDTVYYHLVYSEYDSSISIGWRDGFRREKTEVYRVDLNTMTREHLYTY